MSIKSKLLSGSFWTISSTLVSQGIHFVSFAILARLLNPSDFGLLALALFVNGFVRMFVDMGLGMAMIQSKNVENYQVNTVFWLSLIIAVSIFLIINIIIPFIGYFLNNEDIKDILKIISFIFIIDSLKVVPSALLNKQLKFRITSKTTIINGIVYGLVSIPLAFLGYGVMSLVYGFLISSLISSIYLILSSKWYPKIEFSIKKTKALLKFGVNMAGSNFVKYLSENLDRLFLGKFLGVYDLGIFHLCKRILDLPRILIAQNIGAALFPVLSKEVNDDETYKKVYLSLLNLLLYFTLPLLSFLAYTADIWIPLLFGNKWKEAIHPFRILTIYGVIVSVVSPLGNVYLAKGKSQFLLFTYLITLILVVILTPILSQISLIAVTVGVVLQGFVIFFVTVYFCSKSINMQYVESWKAIYKPLLFTVVLLATIFTSEKFINLFFDSDIFVFIILLILDILTLLILLKIFDSNSYKKLIYYLTNYKSLIPDIIKN